MNSKIRILDFTGNRRFDKAVYNKIYFRVCLVCKFDITGKSKPLSRSTGVPIQFSRQFSFSFFFFILIHVKKCIKLNVSLSVWVSQSRFQYSRKL